MHIVFKLSKYEEHLKRQSYTEAQKGKLLLRMCLTVYEPVMPKFSFQSGASLPDRVVVVRPMFVTCPRVQAIRRPRDLSTNVDCRLEKRHRYTGNHIATGLDEYC